MSNLITFRYHGALGDAIGREWNLLVSSVSEGIRATESISHKLYKFLLDKSQENIRYRIIINGEDYHADNEPSLDNIDSINNCELKMENKNLKTVDIIPVLEGAGKAGGIFTAILGIILIIVGVLTSWVGGGALIVAGVGLLAAGVVNLLTKPPKFEDFREIEQGGKVSYLFNGPENVVGEGGPVPVVYGRLLVGSQVISASYVIRDFNTNNPNDYITDGYLYPKQLSSTNAFGYITYY